MPNISSLEIQDLKSKEAEVIKMNIGKMVDKEQKKLNWTDYKFSKESGISTTQVQSIKSGTKSYTIDSFIKCMKTLKINLVSLKIKSE